MTSLLETIQDQPQALKCFILLLPTLPCTKRDAQTSAEIELRSEADGWAARRTASMIAAIAINHGALLYTFKVGHFKPLEEMGLILFSVTSAN